MLKKLSHKIDEILRTYPNCMTKEAYVRKLRKYRNECGCKLGAIFLFLSLTLSIVHFMYVTSRDWSIILGQLVMYLFFVLISTVVGKFAGILNAFLRLYLLYKSLIHQQKL